MMNYKDRICRLQTIVKYCLEQSITPSKNNFADTVQKLEISKMGRTAKQTAEDINMLCIAWKTDKWKGYKDDIDIINIESTNIPKKINVQTHGTSEEIKKCLQKIADGHSEEIKHISSQIATQPDTLSEQEQARMLYEIAQKDQNDGTGRILLHEARDSLDNKHLTCESVVTLWQKYYPLTEIDPKTANVIHVYFEGKDSLKMQRKLREPVIPDKFVNPKNDLTEVKI